MGAVLKNIDIKGTTMGSRKEFADMVRFVAKNKLKPVISRVAQGLDISQIDTLFDDMKAASQFGKLVVDIQATRNSKI
jgi:D-arabinose 1-dehydrogenase-like Zn-dependent alcohol dehydrogenase